MPRTFSLAALLAAALMLLSAALLAAGPADMALVAVDNPAPGVAARLLERDIMVVRDMDTYLLVAAGREDLGLLDEMDLDWSVLDRSIRGKTYYTVGISRRATIREVNARVRVLRFDGREAVIEASEREAGSLSALGLEIARVFIRPIRVSARERFTTLRATTEYDPAIQTMVNSVSSATIDAGVQRLQDFVTRYATHDSCQAAADWIKAEFESYGIDSVYYHYYHPTYKDNVVATIPGKGDPSKIIVVGGHYDSITSNHENCPGADDNASGTVCALECARVLSNYDFNYTLEFVAFGGEELGLYGSEGYASDAAARGDDIVAAVAVDMIGYVAGGDAMDLDIIDNASSEWIRLLANDVGNLYVPELPIVEGTIPGGASSDHASFWANGYDAILFFEDSGDYSPYIHTTNDVVGLSYNSSTMAERCVKVAVGLLAALAEPFSVAISHTPLENTEDTTNPYRVVADIVAAGTLNADSLLVRYSTGAGENTLAMSGTGNPDEYEAYIPAQPGGTTVSYYIVAEDNASNRRTHPSGAPPNTHTFFVGTITAVVEHDFETDQGWTVGDADDDATTGMWQRCDPEATEAQPEDDHTPAPGVNAYITHCAAGASQGTYDVDGGKTTLFSPTFDLSAHPNAHVRYYRWYSNDTGASPEADDWLVDVSDDGGQTWARIDSIRSSNRTWHMVERNIEDYVELTSDVRFRFIASDEGDGSIVEAGVDDFSIVVYEDASSGAGGSEAIAKLMLSQNVPNPFASETAIRFAVPSPGREISLKVFDVRGREVTTLLEDEEVSGSRTVRWDGTNGRGISVPAGIYFCRLADGEQTLSRKIVLAR
jgi:hypothetical protein